MLFDGYVVMNLGGMGGLFYLEFVVLFYPFEKFFGLVIQFGDFELSELKFLFCGKLSMGDILC